MSVRTIRPVRRRHPQIWRTTTPAVAPPPLDKDLPEALATWFAANTTLATAFGLSGASDIRFWADEAPDGVPLPYLVITDPDEEIDGWQSVDWRGIIGYWGHAQVQISIFATGRAAVRQLGFDVLDAVQDLELIFERGTLHWLRLAHQSTEKDPDQGPDGSDVFQRILMFNAAIERTL